MNATPASAAPAPAPAPAPAGKVRRTTSGTVLSVQDLNVTFPSEAGPVHAVRGLSFDLAAGVRAATPDGLPLVGFSRTPGVILAVGARRNGRAEILAGLSPGQRIVVSGAFGLADGMKVVPAENKP